MPFKQVLKAYGGVPAVEIQPPAEFPGYVFRGVAGPSLGDIEADYPDRIAVLPGEQIGDDSLETGLFDAGLWPYPAEPPEIVDHQVNVLIVAPGHDRRCPAGCTHYATPRYGTGDSSQFGGDSFLNAALRQANSSAPAWVNFT